MLSQSAPFCPHCNVFTTPFGKCELCGRMYQPPTASQGPYPVQTPAQFHHAFQAPVQHHAPSASVQHHVPPAPIYHHVPLAPVYHHAPPAYTSTASVYHHTPPASVYQHEPSSVNYQSGNLSYVPGTSASLRNYTGTGLPTSPSYVSSAHSHPPETSVSPNEGNWGSSPSTANGAVHRPPCKYFVLGRMMDIDTGCDFGDNCYKRHVHNICNNFLRGRCPYTESHDDMIHDMEFWRVADYIIKTPCPHWVNTGNCRYYDACPHPHPDPQRQ